MANYLNKKYFENYIKVNFDQSIKEFKKCNQVYDENGKLTKEAIKIFLAYQTLCNFKELEKLKANAKTEKDAYEEYQKYIDNQAKVLEELGLPSDVIEDIKKEPEKEIDKVLDKNHISYDKETYQETKKEYELEQSNKELSLEEKNAIQKDNEAQLEKEKQAAINDFLVSKAKNPNEKSERADFILLDNDTSPIQEDNELADLEGQIRLSEFKDIIFNRDITKEQNQFLDINPEVKPINKAWQALPINSFIKTINHEYDKLFKNKENPTEELPLTNENKADALDLYSQAKRIHDSRKVPKWYQFKEKADYNKEAKFLEELKQRLLAKGFSEEELERSLKQNGTFMVANSLGKIDRSKFKKNKPQAAKEVIENAKEIKDDFQDQVMKELGQTQTSSPTKNKTINKSNEQVSQKIVETDMTKELQKRLKKELEPRIEITRVHKTDIDFKRVDQEKTVEEEIPSLTPGALTRNNRRDDDDDKRNRH